MKLDVINHYSTCSVLENYTLNTVRLIIYAGHSQCLGHTGTGPQDGDHDLKF